MLTLLQFLVLTPSAPGGGTLPGLLRHFRRFDAFGGLVAHWRLFGKSGLSQQPKSGVLQVVMCGFMSLFVAWQPQLYGLCCSCTLPSRTC